MYVFVAAGVLVHRLLYWGGVGMVSSFVAVGEVCMFLILFGRHRHRSFFLLFLLFLVVFSFFDGYSSLLASCLSLFHS